MDRSNDGVYSQPPDVSTTGAQEGKPSVEARFPQVRSPQTPPRQLQKKRSRTGPHGPARSPAEPGGTVIRTIPQRDSTGATEATKVRKGSLRNAMRRIFGRRSREGEPQPSQISPPRHGYHRSEPTGLPTQPEVPEGQERDDGAQRILSAPMDIIPPPSFQRTRSPYAVEFPQSARLKPLDLGNPFTAPGSQLRRRKTLPSLLISGSEAAALSADIRSSEAPPVPSLDLPREGTTLEAGRGQLRSRSRRSDKRKSRSADDLKEALAERAGLERKRSDEIRYWRQSFQASVLRASGFTVPSESAQASLPRDDDKTPVAIMDDPFDSSVAGPRSSTPPFRRVLARDADAASPLSALGTELSRDLEDRVAKLEAGLQSFRGELAQLSADRNRRTVLIGGVPTSGSRRRASSGGRTASLLADTLQFDIEPSDYQYDYRDTLRPSTSPAPPRTPVSTDPVSVTPNLPERDRAAEEPFRTPSPPHIASMATGDNRAAAGQNQPPQYTFRSLYEMLTDERSARRRLEMQMRTLRDEIANLNYQVSLQSNVQSQRSSYYAAIDPMVGSSRLHALLRDTEQSPPSTAESQRQRPQPARLFTEQRVVSRFSGSDSEGGALAESEELQTPYEAYQTPIEDQGGFPFREHSRDDGEMF